MSSHPANYLPQKIDLTPRKHHGYAVLLFIMGTLLPPLAVAARFGVGRDFWINVVLTICGYIPGHGHNFYIQNIRNNKTHARTPKWVQKYGLVDLSEIKRKERKSQWARRYNDRLPTSALEGQPYAEGQEGGSSIDLSEENARSRRQPNGDLWRPEDEQFYNADKQPSSGSSGRWHYPANFEDAEPIPEIKPKKKKKKDRWERTQDAYSMASEVDTTKKKKRRKRKTSVADDDTSTRDENDGFPEDPEGGLYGERLPPPIPPKATDGPETTGDDIFRHQF